MTNTSNVTNTHNGHEFVDLGLPSGLLWATCNVGATSPEQAGRYFAWGETTGYTIEDCLLGVRKFNKSSYKAKKIKTDLTLEQDAAHVCMGGKWRMPTYTEIWELLDNCYSEWIIYRKNTMVRGRLFTSKINGKSIFILAAGGCSGTEVDFVGEDGYYWSASWDSSLLFNKSDYATFAGCKFRGRPVRAVCER